MFELRITNHIESEFVFPIENKPGFYPKRHSAAVYSDGDIHISGLGFIFDKNDLYENDAWIIFVSGYVFFRNQSSNEAINVPAHRILSAFTANGDGFLNQLKGNFVVVIYDKYSKRLLVAKDQLGLKYLYYKIEGEYFYISTNLNDYKKISHDFNCSAVLEKILFTYPVGSETYLENVFMLENGCFLFSDGKGLIKRQYFDITEIFPDKPLKKFKPGAFLELFENSVLQKSGISSRTNASLTGGFDGRANVAVLINNKNEFQAYSFGIKGGENTVVPLAVSKQLGINYHPVYLNAKYESNYTPCALKAVYFSDGISSFERANYIFAMADIASYSHVNITGLIGGEIFAPVHLKTDYFNELYYDVVYAGKEFDLQKELNKRGLLDCMDGRLIQNQSVVEKINDKIKFRQEKIRQWRTIEWPWTYYLKDLFESGFPRFYGAQMHLERYYCHNLSPFFDLDVIEYLYSTDHLSIFKKAFIHSPFARMNNRKLQSLIIKNYCEELGEINVDRGYPPNYNLDFRKLFIPYIFYRRRQKLKGTLPDFDSPSWSSILYNHILDMNMKASGGIANIRVLEKYLSNYTRGQYNKDINQLLSILLWLET